MEDVDVAEPAQASWVMISSLCSTCGGAGYLVYSGRDLHSGERAVESVRCGMCGGAGRVLRRELRPKERR